MGFEIQQVNHACWGVVDRSSGRFVDLYTSEAAAQADAERRNRAAATSKKAKGKNDLPDDQRP